MKKMFYPESVVVLGVSSSLDNMGKFIVRNLQQFGFKGPIYAVGSRSGEVYGVKIHTSVFDIPEPVDFAAILVPAEHIPQILIDCGRKGIKRVLISSGGFSEYEGGKVKLERVLLDIASNYGLRFLGPNCIGIVNMDNGLCLPFNPMDPNDLRAGNNSLLAQSGGVTLHLGNIFSDEMAGINKMVSFGNKLNIDEVDLLSYLLEDESTKNIFIYLEGMKRCHSFLELAGKSRKPIVVLKANRSPVAGEIARSHTAALASNDDIVEGALRQAGIVRVETLEEMVLCAKVFSLPPLRGNNLVVLSMSGGLAVIGADSSAKYGFQLPSLPDDLLKYIEERRKGGVIHLTNPMDFGDVYDFRVMFHTIERILALDYVNGLVVSLPYMKRMEVYLSKTEGLSLMGKTFRDWTERRNKPIGLSFFTTRSNLDMLKKQIEFPIFDNLTDSIKAFAYSRAFWQHH